VRRILLVSAIAGLVPLSLCAKAGKARREAKGTSAGGAAKAADLNRGQRFYNWLRTNAEDLPEVVSAVVDKSLVNRRVKALTGYGFNAYVSIDGGRSICFLRITPGAPKANEAEELGLLLPSRVRDPGCTGVLGSVDLEWGVEGRGKFTQRELDVLYMIYQDALTPLLPEAPVPTQ
jgi:hypothetical protein